VPAKPDGTVDWVKWYTERPEDFKGAGYMFKVIDGTLYRVW
jgi:hypothetical protein